MKSYKEGVKLIYKQEKFIEHERHQLEKLESELMAFCPHKVGDVIRVNYGIHAGKTMRVRVVEIGRDLGDRIAGFSLIGYVLWPTGVESKDEARSYVELDEEGNTKNLF